jgi:hypothetical protein
MADESLTPLTEEFAAIDRAFRRAVREAREESIRTGTPFHVWQDGKIIDLNARENRAAEASEAYSTNQPGSAGDS